MNMHAGELKAQMGRIETKLEKLGTQVSELKNDMTFVRSVALENNVMLKKVSHDWWLLGIVFVIHHSMLMLSYFACSKNEPFSTDPVVESLCPMRQRQVLERRSGLPERRREHLLASKFA